MIRPDTDHIFVVSTDSSKFIDGSNVGILLAIIVFPEPGGPIIIILCPPAQATSVALLAKNCPLISEKSIEVFSIELFVKKSFCLKVSTLISFFKNFITSCKFVKGYTLTSFATQASFLFFSGTITWVMPNLCKLNTIGKIPFTGLIFPSRDNSPNTHIFCKDSFSNAPLEASIPRAIDKSNIPPSFFISAGARFTVIFFVGKSKPEFFIAEITLSLDSFTETSGNPTIENIGSPDEISTSTSIRQASIPKTVAECEKEIINIPLNYTYYNR